MTHNILTATNPPRLCVSRKSLGQDAKYYAKQFRSEARSFTRPRLAVLRNAFRNRVPIKINSPFTSRFYMVAGNIMLQNRRFYLSLLGVVAWSTTAADSVLDILDAASLRANQSSLVALAATASAFDLLALGAIAVFSSQYAWTREGIIKNAPQAQKTLAACCGMFSFGALILSLASLIATRLGSNDSNYGSAHIALWVLAFLSQIALFTSPMWSPSRSQQSRTTSGPRDSAVSEMRYSTPSQNLYMMEPAHPSSPLAALPSPTMSIRSSQSLKSWKESLQQAVRPMSSRSKLMNRPSFSRDVHSAHSDVLSVNSTADGFDSWEVDAQSKETAAQLVSAQGLLPPRSQNSITHGTPLEPIPGSRPVSPAHPLDGPFSSEYPEEDVEELQPPPKLALDTSRPPSPAGSEAHIHPLFRSESPGPPPAATPGTNIMASPLADKVITCPVRPYNRMRSNSNLSNSNLANATSPKPLAHARSFIDEHDRTMSFSSQHSQRSQRSQESKRSKSRSRSPPSRQMTPPIPDSVFVPSSSRSSVNVARSSTNLHTSYSR